MDVAGCTALVAKQYPTLVKLAGKQRGLVWLVADTCAWPGQQRYEQEGSAQRDKRHADADRDRDAGERDAPRGAWARAVPLRNLEIIPYGRR